MALVPGLETERLRLRQWRESDVDPFFAFYRDPQSAAVYGDGITRSDVWRRVALLVGHWQLRGFGPWALEDKATGKFAGHGGLWFPDGWGDIEVGYGIAPEFRGLGYATEVARRVRDHGYRERGLDRLVSYIDSGNTASRNVVEKLGAVPDGEFLLHDKVHIVYLHTKH
ncbi:MAG: GNAT family N-acetyltransferase [Parvibaculaceae bacterium]